MVSVECSSLAGMAGIVPSGHVIYILDNVLYAVAFDIERLQPIGQPVPIVEGIMTAGAMSGAQFSVSDSGTLVYLSGAGPTFEAPCLVVAGRHGKGDTAASERQELV